MGEQKKAAAEIVDGKKYQCVMNHRQHTEKEEKDFFFQNGMAMIILRQLDNLFRYFFFRCVGNEGVGWCAGRLN